MTGKNIPDQDHPALAVLKMPEISIGHTVTTTFKLFNIPTPRSNWALVDSVFLNNFIVLLISVS